MKKVIWFIALVCLFIGSVCYAQDYRTFRPTSLYTTDQVVYAGRANFYGIIMQTDGVNDVTVTVYDSLTAAGTTLMPEITFVADSDAPTRTIGFNIPIKCYNGIYVDITTSGTVSYKVYYIVGD